MPIVSLIYTVSQLNHMVRKLLEKEIDQVWLSGEISNFSHPSSGHWYFTLKDQRAQIRCAMFRKNNRSINFTPRSGQQVLVQASITLYETRGDYQLITESMQLSGDGLLQQEFEALKQRLSQEGLFEKNNKQVLPSPICRVGIISSISGAALYDILQVLKRRDPSLPIVIYPTTVQGQEAPSQIVQAIELANQRSECDVLIVGRGGGAEEDLSPFNDERVARAIYSSLLPVVSAVGHETNLTISDLIADLRAPTPSTAAELVSRNQLESLRQIKSQQHRIEMGIEYLLAQYHQILIGLQSRLQKQHPQLRLAHQQSNIIELRHRLISSLQLQLRLFQVRYEQLNQRFFQQIPIMHIHKMRQRLQALCFELHKNIHRQFSQYQNTFIQIFSRLEGVSPLRTLERGFSFTTDQAGASVKHIDQLSVGDTLTTRLSDGWVESRVIKISKKLEFPQLRIEKKDFTTTTHTE